jgi:hypothetical protein
MTLATAEDTADTVVQSGRRFRFFPLSTAFCGGELT